MNIYYNITSLKNKENFKPTWLIIKQHNITGLKYFCKTIRKNPIAYKGSGLYWVRHLKSHGNDVTTVWSQLFTDIDLLVETAISLSISHDIVNSNNWANLQIENGIDGNPVGTKLGPHSGEHKSKISNSLTGIKRSKEFKKSASMRATGNTNRLNKRHTTTTKQKISLTKTGQTASAETKQKQSFAKMGAKNHMYGVIQSEETKAKRKATWERKRAEKSALIKITSRS
jgi:hypothetical protein